MKEAIRTDEQAERIRRDLCSQLTNARLLIFEAVQVVKSGLGRPDAPEKKGYADTLIESARNLITGAAVEAKLEGVYMIEDSGIDHAKIEKQVKRQFQQKPAPVKRDRQRQVA